MKKFVAMAMLTTLSMLFCAAPPAEAQKKDITLTTIDIAIKNAEKIVVNANKSIKDAEDRIEKSKKDWLDATVARDKELKDTYSAGFLGKIAAADVKMTTEKKNVETQAKLFADVADDLNAKGGITKANIKVYNDAVDECEKAELKYKNSVADRKRIALEWSDAKKAHAKKIHDAEGTVEHRKGLLRAAEKELSDVRVFLVKSFDSQIDTQKAILGTLPNNNDSKLAGELKDAKKDMDRMQSSLDALLREVGALRQAAKVQPQVQTQIQVQTHVEHYVWQRDCYGGWYLVRIR